MTLTLPFLVVVFFVACGLAAFMGSRKSVIVDFCIAIPTLIVLIVLVQERFHLF